MPIAIGDIHGCLLSLERLVSRLPRNEELIFLGDYVDRGSCSAQVLDYLLELERNRSCRFLKGNHEQMMMDAIHHEERIQTWLTNGGRETLLSFWQEPADWMRLPRREPPLARFVSFHERLLLYHEDEYAIYVHAGLDPSIADIRDQKTHTLLWERERFIRNPERWQGKPVVFGHTPTRRMGIPADGIFKKGKLVGVDTGCVYGGRLTGYDTATGRVYQVPFEQDEMHWKRW